MGNLSKTKLQHTILLTGDGLDGEGEDDGGMQKRLMSIGKLISLAPALKIHDYCEICNNKQVLSLYLSSTNRQINDPAIQGTETEGNLWTTHNPGK